uniref:RRM domain-containing protein n=1 Tax=Gouania willdenowi TaxID=441366 RepID=A0A8C5E1U5_GOUWI
MGSNEANRTLFIRNLDSKVTEEILFELFLQAGPMVKTKIPKDTDGKQKTFGFAVYKHEESVPYAMELLNGTVLHGRSIHVQFRSGKFCNKQDQKNYFRDRMMLPLISRRVFPPCPVDELPSGHTLDKGRGLRGTAIFDERVCVYTALHF